MWSSYICQAHRTQEAAWLPPPTAPAFCESQSKGEDRSSAESGCGAGTQAQSRSSPGEEQPIQACQELSHWFDVSMKWKLLCLVFVASHQFMWVYAPLKVATQGYYQGGSHAKTDDKWFWVRKPPTGSENHQLVQKTPNYIQTSFVRINRDPVWEKGKVLIDTGPSVDLNLHSWLVRASQCIPGYPRAFCGYVLDHVSTGNFQDPAPRTLRRNSMSDLMESIGVQKSCCHFSATCTAANVSPRTV